MLLALAFSIERKGARLAAMLGYRDELSSRKIRAGQRLRILLDLIERPNRNDVAALGAGAGPHVDDDVGLAHRLLVVFDDNQRVAQIAQRLERRQQPRVVTLMQSDRRLVQDVQHADKRRTDLRCQTNALRFTARERRCRTRKVQISETDVGQESQPRANFFEDLMRDQHLTLVELQIAEKLLGTLDRGFRDRGDVLTADRYGEGFRLQTRTVADLHVVGRHEFLDVFLHVVAARFVVTALQVVDHAFERRFVRPCVTAARLVFELLFFSAPYKTVCSKSARPS